MHYKTEYQSPIGKLILASDGENLIGLWMEKQKYFGDNIVNNAIENADLSVFEKTKKWLDSYFAGENPKIDIPLAPTGTDFRKKVWQILSEIPYGQTATYREIASKIAKIENKKSMSAQAVGGAVGHNPISIIVPCHRVVGTNNSLTGYAGGISKKIYLLKLEGVDTSNFSE